MLQLQPELEALSEQGVDLYVIASGLESYVSDFFSENKLLASIIHDTDYAISRQYSVQGVPYVLVVDKQGRVAYAQLGWGATTYDEEMEPLLRTLLAEAD